MIEFVVSHGRTGMQEGYDVREGGENVPVADVAGRVEVPLAEQTHVQVAVQLVCLERPPLGAVPPESSSPGKILD